jgi:hypothetical protein
MEKPNRIRTVGQLRAALEGIPDDTPLTVNAADPAYPEEAVIEQVITSTGFGLVDWGDGYGLEPSGVFGLDCHLAMPEDEVLHKPVRPTRRARAQTVPAAEQAAAEAEPEAQP